MRDTVEQLLEKLGGYSTLLMQSLYWTVVAPWKGSKVGWRQVFAQMNEFGIRSLGVVVLIMFFIGLILAMESAQELIKIGTVDLLSSIVCVSILRQMGPLIVACIVIARCGSAMAAELGSMKVSEEIEALKTMAINPVRFLITPRLLAMAVMNPVLTIIGSFVGCVSGMLYAEFVFNIPPNVFFESAIHRLAVMDVLIGVIKSFVFGILIVTISCYYAFGVEGGSEGVGKATTNSVVMSVVAVIVANALLTGLLISFI
ncbi:ABC transporter permease [Kamptonema cortianum]|nr:ABC transporter permease [Kamptonema cortianum]MDL5044542.1 ABC transporter permease [Oscillatoria amoena NRMC-F 0135]